MSDSERPYLVAHTRDGVITVPLTGEPAHDALLERFARRGGPVTTSDGELRVPVTTDPDGAARDAMREGA